MHFTFPRREHERKSLVASERPQPTLGRMSRTFGLIGIVIVLGIGGYVYTRQMQTATPNGQTPQTTIDVTGVENDLIALANAERQYWATNARYASLEELRSSGSIQVPGRPNYTYSAEAGETTFTVIASYSGPDSHAPQRLSIDETMALKSQ